MPFVYDEPIGPVQPGKTVAPVGSLLNTTLKGASDMIGTSGLPNLTGGAAGPSQAIAGDIKNFINNVSGGGGLFWVGLTVIAGLVIWKFIPKRK